MSISDVKRALSAILLAARNLKSLSILDLNVFVFRPDELKTLLDSLPRLCDLEMSGIENKYEGVLVGVLPRLRTLGLEFLEKSNASAFLKVETPQRDLQEVTLYNASFKNPYAPLSFPSVHTLRVCPARFPSDVDALTRLFPNVVDLTFDFHPEYGHLNTKYRKDVRRYRPTMPWTDPLVKKWRDRLLSRPEKEPDAWPHIQTLRAAGPGIGKLAWAGLTFQVPRVEFEVCSRHITTQQLAGVLSELRPRCVVLHPGLFHGRWYNDAVGWGLLAALQNALSVTRLSIVLCEGMRNTFSHALRLLAEQAAHLGKCAVSCLVVRRDFDCFVSQQHRHPCHFELSNKIPSLRVLVFQIKDRVPLGWAKEERAGGRWKEMSEDEARKFIASEKMCTALVEPCEQCEAVRLERLRYAY